MCLNAIKWRFKIETSWKKKTIFCWNRYNGTGQTPPDDIVFFLSVSPFSLDLDATNTEIVFCAIAS